MCKNCPWYYGEIKRLNRFGCFDCFINCLFFGLIPVHVNQSTCRARQHRKATR